jgi:hypothetical protein
MKRVPYAVCLSLLLCSPILAQDEAPVTEIFGGYSHSIGRHQGWNVSVAVNPTQWLGVVADFSGLTQKDSEQDLEGQVRANSFLFGPQFSYRGNRRVRPFVRMLFGATGIIARGQLLVRAYPIQGLVIQPAAAWTFGSAEYYQFAPYRLTISTQVSSTRVS